MFIARLLLLLLVLGAGSRAWAQDVPNGPDRYRTDVAGDRPQPEFDPLGVRIGSFLMHADGELDIGYNSNLFARAQSIVGDSFVRLGPSFQLRSDWGRHAFELSGSARFTRYAKTQTENSTDARVHAAGSIEIGDRLVVRPTFDAARLAEPRGSAENRLTLGSPLYHRQLAGNVGAQYDGGRVKIETLVAYRHNRYNPVVVNGATVTQRIRDVDGIGGRVTVLYSVTPALSALVQTVADSTRNPHPEFCCLRDAHGYAALAGFRLDPSGLIAGQVAVGYRRRFFSGSGTSSRGLTYDARLQWYPTELVTVDVRAEQQFRNSGITAANAVLVGHQSIGAAYEMYRNLLINIEAEHESSTYRQTNTRTSLRSLSLRAAYTPSRPVRLSAFAEVQMNRTNQPALASGYKTLRLGLSITGRL